MLLLISFLISISNIIIIRDTYIKYRERRYYKDYYDEDIYDVKMELYKYILIILSSFTIILPVIFSLFLLIAYNKKEEELYWKEAQKTYYLKGNNIITKLLLVIRKIICKILNLLNKKI